MKINTNRCCFTPLNIKLARSLFRSNVKVFLIILLALTFILTPLSCLLTIRHHKDLQDNISTQYSHLIQELQNTVYFATTQLEYAPKEYWGNSNAMSLLLENIVQSHYNPKILHIFLETPEHIVFESNNNKYLDGYSFLEQDARYADLLEGKLSTIVSSPLDFQDSAGINRKMIYYCSRIEVRSEYYCITLFYNINSYISCTESLLNNYAIIDRKGQILISSGDLPAVAAQFHMQSPKEEYQFSLEGLLLKERNYLTGFTIVSILFYFELLSYALITVLTIIAVLTLTLFLEYRSINAISFDALKPLSTLRNTMTNYKLGQSFQLDIHTNDEIEDLSVRFCEMVHDIEFQFELASAAKQAEILSKYKLLATQIDPHYIYNTLSVINAEARQQNYESVIAINMALSKVLRTILSVNKTVFSTIYDEIEALKAYVQIMKYRYNEDVSVSYDIQPEVEKLMIPRNILQPLVENSFLHGLQRDNGEIHGRISIDIYLDGNDIIAEINDDGIGIPEDILQSFSIGDFNHNDAREHIGINNVKQRLSCVYGEKSSMEIRSERGYGTTIVLIIPTDGVSSLWNNVNLN